MKHPLYLFAPFLILLSVCASQPSRARAASAPPSSASEKSSIESRPATITIPGPLRSFLRMAAISQKVSPDEVVPLLSRNVFLIGYNGPGRRGQPTEFLLVLRRYVQQARELAALAGPDGAIHASNCEDAKPLLRILGYKISADCGPKNNFLQAADPQRAFLTTDSGFPLSELERTLSGGAP